MNTSLLLFSPYEQFKNKTCVNFGFTQSNSRLVLIKRGIFKLTMTEQLLFILNGNIMLR